MVYCLFQRPRLSRACSPIEFAAPYGAGKRFFDCSCLLFEDVSVWHRCFGCRISVELLEDVLSATLLCSGASLHRRPQFCRRLYCSLISRQTMMLSKLLMLSGVPNCVCNESLFSKRRERRAKKHIQYASMHTLHTLPAHARWHICTPKTREIHVTRTKQKGETLGETDFLRCSLRFSSLALSRALDTEWARTQEHTQ